tara:strand:+ start:831 stop:1838 length:1008 start_codon:yes stop_codon:yes gene_type:complete
MNILITGGCGFIGSHLTELSLSKGHKVTIIDDLSTGQIKNITHLETNPSLKIYRDSIFNTELLSELIHSNDIIFHLAAAVGVQLIVEKPVETIETNVFGTHNVIKLASQFKKKLLIASTSEIYGKNSKTPFSEDSDRLLGPTTISRWSYSSSKAIDEFMALAYHQEFGLDVIIFRLFNTVGPRQTGRYGMVLPNFVSKALSNEKIIVHGTGTQSRCFCDVSDVVKAIFNLSEEESASGQIFNIGSMNEITINDLALKVLQVVNKKRNHDITIDDSNLNKHIDFVNYEQVFGKNFQDMMRRVPNTEKIQKLTGWHPKIDLDTTVERVTKYLMESNL